MFVLGTQHKHCSIFFDEKILINLDHVVKIIVHKERTETDESQHTILYMGNMDDRYENIIKVSETPKELFATAFEIKPKTLIPLDFKEASNGI